MNLALLLPTVVACAHRPPVAPAPEAPVSVVVMERVDDGEVPVFAPVDDAERAAAVRGWMVNEAADFALALYASAWSRTRQGEPTFYVALESGGNHASSGFALRAQGGEVVHPELPYILLDERPYRFERTLLHETGHMVLGLLGAQGHQLPAGYVLHTTPAVTDRWTAFNEGFAQHLETIWAERTTSPGARQHLDNRVPQHGPDGPHLLAPLGDLRTLSQSRQRFHGVRDNRFAHPALYQGDDLLRHAVDPERDLSRLRNASQILACEGFVATVFYRLVPSGPTLDVAGYDPLIDALAVVFADGLGETDHRWLLHTISALAQSDPQAWEVFLDLSRGVTMSGQALEAWSGMYADALRVDSQSHRDNSNRLKGWYQGWLDDLQRDPAALGRLVGSEVFACIEGVTVRPQLLDRQIPVCLDLNAADQAELAAVPGAQPAWVHQVMEERMSSPYEDLDDLWARAPSPDVEGLLRPPHEPPSLEQSTAHALEIVRRFAEQHGWKEHAVAPFWTGVEIFADQTPLWTRILEIHELPTDTELPTDGLAAALEGERLLAIEREVYAALRPEYQTRPDAWERLLAHEVVHRLHVRILAGDEDAMGPTWFFEGFAVLGADQRLGVAPTFTSAAEALEATRADGRGAYAHYGAAVAWFAERAGLPALVARAGDEDFMEWLATL